MHFKKKKNKDRQREWILPLPIVTFRKKIINVHMNVKYFLVKIYKGDNK